MPAFVLPRLVGSGVLVPREGMPESIGTVGDAVPLAYAFDALARRPPTTSTRVDVAVVGGCIAPAPVPVLGAVTLRWRAT